MQIHAQYKATTSRDAQVWVSTVCVCVSEHSVCVCVWAQCVCVCVCVFRTWATVSPWWSVAHRWHPSAPSSSPCHLPACPAASTSGCCPRDPQEEWADHRVSVDQLTVKIKAVMLSWWLDWHNAYYYCYYYYTQDTFLIKIVIIIKLSC